MAVTATVAVGALTLPPVSAGATAPGAPLRVQVGSPPQLPVGSTPVAPLAAAAPLSVDVVLQPRDPGALSSYAFAVSSPGSPQYRRYLSEAQFVARFGPTQTTVDSVRRALAGVGLHPGPTTINNLSIPIRGSAAQLASAFSTAFRQYRIPGGRIAYANTSAPQMAGSVAPFVQSIVGLDDLSLASPAGGPATPGDTAGGMVGPDTATGGPQACRTASTDATELGAYTADRVAGAYGFPNLYRQGDLGSDQAVALYELQGFGASDIATYQSCFHTSTKVTTVNVDGGPLANAGVGEADVDIEQVVSLAPDARVLVYQGPNNGPGGYDTYASIIDHDQAKVISTSWGLCEHLTGSVTAQAENTLFEEAAVQGQTIVAASGDEGSEDCLGSDGSFDKTQAVDDPASQPFVTGVGGTSWTAAGTPPTESAWNDDTCCWGAGGGGVSKLWTMPSYQAHTSAPGIVSAYSSGKPCGAPTGSYCREVPDVSALAGPFPYLDYVGGGWGAWGGTSLSAPLWASLVALSNASSSCRGKNIGFANPILYRVASTDPAAFNDVTVGSNDLTGLLHGKYPATRGYDMATGLGTPNASLPAALCADAPAEPVSVVNPGARRSPLGQTVRLQIRAADTTPGQRIGYRAIGLPPGLTINATDGLISGRPTTLGSSAVLVTARDTAGNSASVSFTWVVDVAITSATSAEATVGRPFTFTVRTNGTPRVFSVTPTPPAGLRFKNLWNGTATLSGIPGVHDTPGAYALVFEADFGTRVAPHPVFQKFTLTLIAAK